MTDGQLTPSSSSWDSFINLSFSSAITDGSLRRDFRPARAASTQRLRVSGSGDGTKVRVPKWLNDGVQKIVQLAKECIEYLKSNLSNYDKLSSIGQSLFSGLLEHHFYDGSVRPV